MGAIDFEAFVTRAAMPRRTTDKARPAAPPESTTRQQHCSLRAFQYSPDKGNVFDWILQKTQQARMK